MTTGDKPLIEIVSHCYALELPHYAACLRYQLSSFLLHAPMQCDILATVCCCEDRATLNVLEWFQRHTPLRTKVILLPRDQLGRRCIGRNIAALGSKADIIWFADVDQVYGDGVLDRLATLPWPSESIPGQEFGLASMVFPRDIKIHRDHATGDKVAVTVGPGLVDVDPAEFIDHHYHRAIGGVQIVRGDFARQHGYLNGVKKWQKSVQQGRLFGDFNDDIAYRKQCLVHGPIMPIDLPGVYRIRHSRTSYRRRGG